MTAAESPAMGLLGPAVPRRSRHPSRHASASSRPVTTATTAPAACIASWQARWAGERRPPAAFSSRPNTVTRQVRHPYPSGSPLRSGCEPRRWGHETQRRRARRVSADARIPRAATLLLAYGGSFQIVQAVAHRAVGGLVELAIAENAPGWAANRCRGLGQRDDLAAPKQPYEPGLVVTG